MDPPETRYVTVDDAQVAYQVFGRGPDVVFAFGFLTHIDRRWEDPDFTRFMRRAASFSRVILFDRRGTGASDPLPTAGVFSWEGWVDDLNAVLEATGSERAALVGTIDAGAMAMLFTATYPDRVTALVLTSSAASAKPAPGYPLGVPVAQRELIPRLFEEGWGKDDPALATVFVPDRAGDPEFRRWYARLQRSSMTPRRAAESIRWILEIDSRHLLPLIRVPTLVVGLTDFLPVPLDNARYLAEHIEGARLLILRGGNGGATWLNEPDRYLAAIEELVTGEHRPVEPDRVLATVLFTDIVGSTERATEVGDRRWRELLDRHDEIAARQVKRFDGRLIKSTGDGILATFDGPARAVRCARELADDLARVGIPVRSGIHAGEVEVRGDDVGGIAVHIAARVMALAAPEEILVSETLKGLVTGSGLSFEPRGTHRLKGLPDEWPLHALVTS